MILQDGPVGRVIDFLVDSETRHITHVVIRGGSFWRRKDIMLPVAVIAYIEENKIYLKIDKRTFNSLLRIQVYETLFRPLPPPGL